MAGGRLHESPEDLSPDTREMHRALVSLIEELEAISEALEQLRQAGVAGPYAVVLSPDAYSTLHRSSGEGGYPVLRRVQRLIDRPVVWAPSLQGGVVVSLRGGDFKLACGRGAAIGYLSHDEKNFRLYLEESFSAELNGPEAAVPLLAPNFEIPTQTRRRT